jgi:hypothetical protein
MAFQFINPEALYFSHQLKSHLNETFYDSASLKLYDAFWRAYFIAPFPFQAPHYLGFSIGLRELSDG